MSDETPTPRSEVKKLPRSKCELCGLEGPKPMVHNGRCVRTDLCAMRQRRNAERRQARGGK